MKIKVEYNKNKMASRRSSYVKIISHAVPLKLYKFQYFKSFKWAKVKYIYIYMLYYIFDIFFKKFLYKQFPKFGSNIPPHVSSISMRNSKQMSGIFFILYLSLFFLLLFTLPFTITFFVAIKFLTHLKWEQRNSFRP